MTNVASIDLEPACIRAISIDVLGNQAVVGCRNGNILHINLADGERKILMKSHSDGEVWGLSVVGTNGVMTSGDDNKMFFWNYTSF